jgi:hypothetical protein
MSNKRCKWLHDDRVPGEWWGNDSGLLYIDEV